MQGSDIGRRRLFNQRISEATCEKPGDVVGWLGAVQAQDYLGALWAVGLRMPAATDRDVEKAIGDRTIIRTWPMRGTLHFVAAPDVRWMLQLLTPRVIARGASRERQLELDDAVFAQSAELFSRSLEGGKQLSRGAMYQVLEAGQISTAGQRGIHILGRLAQEGLLCYGPRQGKQPTFVLLDEWAPGARKLERDEALAELARRYFTGHGPAAVQDLVWWSGLTTADARAGLEMVKDELIQESIDGQVLWSSGAATVHEDAPGVSLLPPFDEYLVGYRIREAVLRPADKQRVVPGSNGVFNPIVVIDGQVAGTWRRTFKKGSVVVTSQPFSPWSDAEYEGFALAAEHYGRFLNMPVTLA